MAEIVSVSSGTPQPNEEFPTRDTDMPTRLEPKSNVIDLKEEAEKRDPRLKVVNQLNERHIFVDSLGGKSCVTRLTLDQVHKKDTIEFLPLDTFKNIHLNKKIEVEDEVTKRDRVSLKSPISGLRMKKEIPSKVLYLTQLYTVVLW